MNMYMGSKILRNLIAIYIAKYINKEVKVTMNYYLNVRTKIIHSSECHYVKNNAKGRLFNDNWIKFGSLKVAEEHCKEIKIKYKHCKSCI